jgi:hypothetical protein
MIREPAWRIDTDDPRPPRLEPVDHVGWRRQTLGSRDDLEPRWSARGDDGNMKPLSPPADINPRPGPAARHHIPR